MLKLTYLGLLSNIEGFMVRRPRIAITTRLESQTQRFYLGRDYSEAIESSGALPFLLPLIPNRDYIAAVLDGVDGVLLPGSNTDVDPHLYGEQPHPMLGTVIPEKDETDQLVIDEAERRGLPLMGICYGMQALNVYRGGSLIQDIHSSLPNCIKHEQGFPAGRPSHSIEVDVDSRLGSLRSVIQANGQARVNSSHHQALGKIGEGLRPVAWATDGVIEAVEGIDQERFVLGVQWHPELMAATDDVSRELFELFVGICAKPRQYNKLSAVN
jgi:putative glutamine amidotransferase